jgi:hypothetical protein
VVEHRPLEHESKALSSNLSTRKKQTILNAKNDALPSLFVKEYFSHPLASVSNAHY